MIALLLGLLAPAQAQQGCIEPMSRIQLGAAVGRVTDALSASELVEARIQLNDVLQRMPCLDQVLDPELFALFARYNAVVHYYGQEEDQALRWGIASRLALPTLPWDETLFPPEHAVRRMIESAPLSAPVTLEGKGFMAPRGGGVFANGAFLAKPTGYAEVPVLVQVFDRNQRKTEAFWQEGSLTFPDDLVSVKEGPMPPPVWLGTPVVSNSPAPALTRPVPVPKPERVRTGEPLPVLPIVGSLALGAVSGTTYLLASRSAKTFSLASAPNAATASEDLTGLRTRTNLLVMASGVTLAGAIGVGVTGVFVGGQF